MNASNQTELSGGGGSAHSTPLAIFDDVEHIIITLSGLAAGVFLTCGCFFLFNCLQNRRNRRDAEFL